MRKVIEVENLTKKYEGTIAVDHISFDVEEGEVVSFIGPNGAGKTTTIRMMGGVFKPDEGRVSIMGYDVQKDPIEVKKRIGVLTEGYSLYERMNAFENLDFFAELYELPLATKSNRIKEVLDTMGLLDRARDTVGKYSKGMKKRLSIARSLLNNPPVLFLDEPTSDLDPIGAKEIRDCISKLSKDRGMTIFICTHNLFIAEIVASKVIVMNKGKILVNEPLETLMGKYAHFEIVVNGDRHSQLASELGSNGWLDLSRTTNGGGLVLKLRGREKLEKLTRFIKDKGGELAAVKEERSNLEDVFIEIIQGAKN